MDKETAELLLQNLDVQRFYKTLEGLINGTKKLVIESNIISYHPFANDPAYKHTFRVEDVDEAG